MKGQWRFLCSCIISEAAVSLNERMVSSTPGFFERHIVLLYYLYDYLQYCLLNTHKCAHIKDWKHFHLHIVSPWIPRTKGRFTIFPDLNIQIEGKCLADPFFPLNMYVCVSEKKLTHASPPQCFQYLNVPYFSKAARLVLSLTLKAKAQVFDVNSHLITYFRN